MNEQKAKAIGAVLGVGNLGFSEDQINVKQIIKECDGDYRKIVFQIEQAMGTFAESDEQYDSMMEELDVWYKEALKDDEFVIKEWNKIIKEIDEDDLSYHIIGVE